MSDDEDYRQYDIREGIIFLIELNEEIYAPVKELHGQSQMLEILYSINELMKQLVITSHNSGVGIYLYNCSKPSDKFPETAHMQRIFKLHELNSADMKRLNSLIDDDLLKFNLIKDKYPPGSEVDLDTVLKVIEDDFYSESAKKFNRRKLVWLTGNDNPGQINKENLRSIRNVIRSMDDKYINIEPIFLNKGTNFDLKFYEDIFLHNSSFLKERTLEIRSSKLAKGPTVSKRLKSLILRLKYVNRVQISCNLILSDGSAAGRLGCSIKGYTLYSHEKATTSKKLYHDEIVQLEQVLKLKVSGEPIDLPDPDSPYSERRYAAGIRAGLEVSKDEDNPKVKEVLYFTREQMNFMKNYTFDHNKDKRETEAFEFSDDEDEDIRTDVEMSAPPYLKLMGFRPLATFQPYYNVAPPLFVTYDHLNGISSEVGYQGSKEIFRDLYNTMVKLGKYAMLFGCVKKNSTPGTLILYPTNVAMSTKRSPLPDGFLLLRVPFTDDLRSLPTHIIRDESLRVKLRDRDSFVPQELVQKYKTLMDSCEFDNYEPQEFPNPNLNNFYNTLRGMALNLPQEDATIEKYDRSLLLMQSVYSQFQSSQDIVKSISEELESAEQQEEPPAKKQKTELNENDILSAWKNDYLEKFTLPELRSFTKKYKIKAAARKLDLVENIKQFLQSRQE